MQCVVLFNLIFRDGPFLREGLGGVGEWNVNIFLYFHFVIKYPPCGHRG